MARVHLSFAEKTSSDAPQPLGAVRVDRADPKLGSRILPILGMSTSFVLVSAAEPVAPAVLADPPPESLGKAYEIVRLRCSPTLSIAGILGECCRKLEVLPGKDVASMHGAVTAKLLRHARQGVNPILLLEDAGQLSDAVLVGIPQLFRLGERCLLPTLLVASPAFVERLQGPALGALRESIAAHFRLEPSLPAPAAVDRPVSTMPTRARTDEVAPPTPAAIEPPTTVETPAASSGDTLAAMANDAARLLKNQEKKETPPIAEPIRARSIPVPPGEARAAKAEIADLQDLATILRGLGDRLPPGAATTATDTAPRRAAAATDERPTASRPPDEEAASIAASFETGTGGRRRGAVAVFASLYVVGSLVVGGGILHLWRSGHLAASAEWLAEAKSWLPMGVARLSSAPPRLAEAAPPNGDVSERLDPDLAPMNETAAAESITAGVGTHALSADLDEASLGSDSAMASPAAVSASAAVASPGVAAAPDPVAPPPASPAPGSPAAAPAGSREAPAARSAPPAEVARVVDRGDQVLVTGDIAAARLLYGWAASTGDARAALALGKTHDPLYLALLRARGPWADREMAIEWYAIAAARGSREAAARLASLTEKSDDSAGGAR